MSKIGYPCFHGASGDSVRASRSPKHRASTPDESLSPPTGRGLVSFMGNGERGASQAGTLCGECWHNTFYRRVREYEAEHWITEPVSALSFFEHQAAAYNSCQFQLPPAELLSVLQAPPPTARFFRKADREKAAPSR